MDSSAELHIPRSIGQPAIYIYVKKWAALSIPTNIVEGYSRKGDKELARFINISIGSMAETEYLLDFSKRLGYVTEIEHQRIEAIRSEVGRFLWNFYKKVTE